MYELEKISNEKLINMYQLIEFDYAGYVDNGIEDEHPHWNEFLIAREAVSTEIIFRMLEDAPQPPQ